MNKQEVKKYVNTLLNAMDYQKVRLRNGMMRRAAMASQIEKGEKPEGARADWLRNTVTDLAAALEVKAIQFNSENPDDLISVHDMVDALYTAIGAIQDAALGENKK